VQTADERILPKGTAYITDVGMTGPEMSVIGSRPDLSLERQLTQMPIKSEILDDSTMINGVLLSIDIETGNAEKIERVFRKFAF
ncbi:MAG: YmdB family metallophosphoesterase, partial [Spirochaetales bacterium]|nr:YmdB family metallophosphoesterase [Spirochaetales bacterium]